MDAIYKGTNGADSLSVPAYPDNNTALAGLGGDDILYDSMSFGFTRFNALYGGSGNDFYVTSQNSKVFIGDVSGVDTIVLPYSYNTFLWRVYDDGDATIIDGSHLHLEVDEYELFIQDFSNPQHKIEYMQFSDTILSFDSVFSLFLHDLDYDSLYEFNPYVRQKLYESMVLRDTLGTQESGSSGNPGGGNPGGGNPGGGLNPLYYDDTMYCSQKAAQMNALDGSGSWSVDTLQQVIRNAGMSNKQHFETFGAYEQNHKGEFGIDPSATFDTSKYYLWKQSLMQRDGTNISMQELVNVFKNAKIDPVTHYTQFGYTEGLRAMEVKDDNINGMTEWNEAKYYAANPDVANAVNIGTIGCGFEHYALYGQFEGRAVG